ncbi:helix-turn-helix domain-containing protein [uncultured Arcticibacterium sp.]|uniref:helix-turn-helix domain-containing protein n=1 Tax=uncultured Arcticibacterium sp. TaxID=2173042 RepID=UPI0030FC4698
MTKVIVTTAEELEEIIAQILKRNLLYNSLSREKEERSIMSIDEASEYLQIPKNTLYRYTSQRKVPHKKIGRSLKFKREELVDWLAENKRKTIKEIQNEN